MEFVVAKAVQLSAIGFGIGGGFRAFCLTEDYLKHRVKPPSPLLHGGALGALTCAELKAAQLATPTLHHEHEVRPLFERLEPLVYRYVQPRWQTWSLASLRFLLVPPGPSKPPSWPSLFWKPGDTNPSRLRIASQIAATACQEGMRTAGLLALGSLVMGAAALLTAPRPVNVDYLMDVRENSGAAGVGVAAVVYVHSNTQVPAHAVGDAAVAPLARLPRAFIAAACGGVFVFALRHGQQQRRKDDW